MKNVPFYELLKEDSPESWHLGIKPESGGSGGARYYWRDITWGCQVDVAPPLEIVVRKMGVRSDYTKDIVAGAPVLSGRAMEIIRGLVCDEAEFIPARVEGEATEYFVMNILSRVKCLDEERTQYVEKWTKDSNRPDLAGEYKKVRGIVIHQAAAIGRNLFRMWGSPQHIIVSQRVKDAFEGNGLTGARFCDVSSPTMPQGLRG